MDRYQKYASHLPVLLAAVARTTGRVLELGCGHGSTPFLHEVAQRGRQVVSVEHSPTYFAEFHVLDGADHRFFWFPDSAAWKDLCLEPWDVVLVDSAPSSSRALVLPWLSHVRLVVVHDTEPAVARSYPGMHEAMAAFAYQGEWCPTGLPWTRVVSNVDADLQWVAEDPS